MGRRGVLLITLLACVALLAPVGAHPAPVCGWPMYGHDPGHSGAQTAACAAIDATNVATLRPAWGIPTGDNVTASPSVHNGIVYVGSWDGTFYAIDAVSGAQLWTFRIDDESRVAFGRIVSTAAIDRVRVPGAGAVDVVLFGGGATLYALAPGRVGPRVLAKISVDPRTPALRRAQAADPPQVEIESSPLVGHFRDRDRIFVGMDVHNQNRIGRTGLLSFGLRKNPRGAATPYRFELLYKFDPETGKVRHSLTEGSGTGWGCGGVWSSPVVAPAALGGKGVVVFGTSNCGDDESAAAGEVGREAMFALDATSGRMLWRFAPRGPNDIDDDFGSSPNLLPGGAVGEGGKDGWYYARGLVTGRELWRRHAAQPGHVNPGFAVGGFIGTPAVGEAIDPVRGTRRTAVFGATSIPTPIGAPIEPGEPLDPREPPLDTTLITDVDPARLLSLHAMDAATGEILWRSPLAGPTYGHVTYANGVVFVSLTTGLRIQAFEAGTGLPLWLTPTFGAPSGAPVIVGDMLFFGTGTRETDVEFKAFGDQIEELVSGPFGEHPLSRLSGIFAYKLAP
jgi:polyvinyl alcohol dehydrogenase (cytochrome)